jgi:hypothetical protein
MRLGLALLATSLPARDVPACVDMGERVVAPQSAMFHGSRSHPFIDVVCDLPGALSADRDVECTPLLSLDQSRRSFCENEWGGVVGSLGSPEGVALELARSRDTARIDEEFAFGSNQVPAVVSSE